MKNLQRIWNGMSVIVFLYTALLLFWHFGPLPLIEPNSTTLVCRPAHACTATTNALTIALGQPSATLDTEYIKRTLYQDGTSVDFVEISDDELMYDIVALKQVVLSPHNKEDPYEIALRMTASLQYDGYVWHIVRQPDPAFARDDIVLVLSEAFISAPGAGFAVLVRKNAMQITGPRPIPLE